MDLKKIEELIEVLEESEISEITVRGDEGGVTIKKGRRPVVVHRAAEAAVASSQPASDTASSTSVADEPGEREIKAPMVGIFHMLEQGPKIGGRIQPGQVVGVIESMKLMNDVRADVGGVLVAMPVEEGTPVEYGQALMRVKQAVPSTAKEA